MYIARFIIGSALFLILQDFGQSCEMCSFGHWLPWSSCSKTCGGGQTSRQRVICCSIKFSYAHCIMTICRVSESDIWQTSSCNRICQNGGIFENARCNCSAGWNGPCCNTGNKCILYYIFLLVVSDVFASWQLPMQSVPILPTSTDVVSSNRDQREVYNIMCQ